MSPLDLVEGRRRIRLLFQMQHLIAQRNIFVYHMDLEKKPKTQQTTDLVIVSETQFIPLKNYNVGITEIQNCHEM